MTQLHKLLACGALLLSSDSNDCRRASTCTQAGRQVMRWDSQHRSDHRSDRSCGEGAGGAPQVPSMHARVRTHLWHAGPLRGVVACAVADDVPDVLWDGLEARGAEARRDLVRKLLRRVQHTVQLQPAAHARAEGQTSQSRTPFTQMHVYVCSCHAGS